MSISSIQTADTLHAVAKSTTPPLSGDETQLGAAAEAPAPGKNFYFSTALVIDPKSGTDVLQYRDGQSGEVTGQYPSEKDLRAYAQNSLKKPEEEPAPQPAKIGEDAANTPTLLATASIRVQALQSSASQPRVAENSDPDHTVAKASVIV